MSGGVDELPDRDGQGEDTRGSSAQRQRRERERVAAELDIESANVAVRDTPGGVETRVRSDGVETIGERRRETVRQEAAAQSDRFEAADFAVREADGGEAFTAAPTADAVERERREQAAAQFDEQFEGVGIAPDDVTLEGDGEAGLAEDARQTVQRQQAAAQFDEQFEGVDVSPSDVELGDEGAALLGDARRDIQRQQAAVEFDDEFDAVDVTPADVEFTDDGNVTVDDDIVTAQEADELLDATDGVPVGRGDPGALAANVIAQEQDVNQRLVLRDALERSGAGDLSPSTDSPFEIAAALDADAVDESLDAFGRDSEQTAPFQDRFITPTGDDLDDALRQFDQTVEQRRTLAENNPEQFLEETDPEALAAARDDALSSRQFAAAEFRAERDARQEAADQFNEQIDETDIDITDVTLEGGEAQLDESTVETVEFRREEAARSRAADQLDDQFESAAIGEDDITIEDGQARLSDDAVDEVEAARTFEARRDAAEQFDQQFESRDIGVGDVQQTDAGFTVGEDLRRQAAREDAAAQLDAQTQVDIGADDVTLSQTDGGFEAALDAEAREAVGETRQDIAEAITPDESAAFRDAGAFGGPTDVTTDLNADFEAETMAERQGIAGDGAIASLDVPGVDDDIGGVLDRGAAAFDREVTDPATDLARDLGATGTPFQPASSGRGQLAADFTRTAVGAANVPGALAGGVRLGDELSERVEPGGVGQPITLSDPEQAQRDIDLATDVGEAGAEFAVENPGRTGAFVAGGAVGGLAAGSALRLGGRGAVRGARAARNVDLDFEDFRADTRAMAGGRRGQTIELEQTEFEVDDLDTSSARRQAEELDEMFDDPDALAREQARVLERERLPPRDAFESDDAFETALSERVARRLDEDIDDVTRQAQSATATRTVDDRLLTQAGATAGTATALEAAAFRDRPAGTEDTAGAFAGPGGLEAEASVFGEQTEATAGAFTGLDTDTATETVTDQLFDQPTDTTVGQPTDTVTDQLFDQPTDTTTATDGLFGRPTTTTTTTDQTFGQPTTTTTVEPTGVRATPRPRPRPRPRADPDDDGQDDAPFPSVEFDADDALFDSGLADAEDFFN
jgi:hypothetical protein